MLGQLQPAMEAFAEAINVLESSHGVVGVHLRRWKWEVTAASTLVRVQECKDDVCDGLLDRQCSY